jgi:nucleoside-diphosphate-sugar epimerase
MERSVLITGANGGLGNAFVSQLVKQSSYGIYAVRDPHTDHITNFSPSIPVHWTAFLLLLPGSINGFHPERFRQYRH